MSKMTEKYKPGTVPRYVPYAVSIPESATDGYLRHNVEVAKFLREQARAGKKYVASATVAADMDIRRARRVEKAASCIGLKIVYAAQKREWGERKTTISVRAIVLDGEQIEKYLREVKDYVRRRRRK